MKQNVKGMLLSGLVFPGLGQISMGKRTMGYVMVILTMAGMVGLTYGLTQRIPPLVEQVVLDMGDQVDFSRIVDLSMQAVSTQQWWLEKICANLLLLCWVGSIIHAGVVGRRRD